MSWRKPQAVLFTVLTFLVVGEVLFLFSQFQDTLFLSLDGIKVSEAVQDEKILAAVLAQMGVKGTMGKLLSETGGGSLQDCHQEAHYIGRAAYKVYPKQVFQECDSSCHSGCYHGAMEGVLLEQGTLDVLGSLEDVCRSFDSAFGVFECYHGLGHAILAYLNYDLPGTIDECKKLSNTIGFEINACYAGAFMENIVTGQGFGAAASPHATTWLNETDFHFPCNALEQDYYVQHACYSMQTSWMLYLNNNNFDAVVAECHDAPENMVPMCFKSLGRDIAGYTLRNPERIVELCSKVPKENHHYDHCIDGALNVVIDFWGPELKGQASGLCKLVEGPSKRICYLILADAIPFIFNNPQEADPVCQSFEEQYRGFCSPS